MAILGDVVATRAKVSAVVFEEPGTMTLRDAFAKSINTIAVKLGERADRTRVTAGV